MSSLNEAQATAASNPTRIQLTLAGPGSGKTTTLVGRFVHLVRQGVDPRRILAVTYTKKAAEELAARVAASLGLPSAKGLWVRTFHSFAYLELKRNPGLNGLRESFDLWMEPQMRHVFSSRKMWWNEENDITDIISSAKERLVSAEAFPKWVASRGDAIPDYYQQAVAYYDVYERSLRDAGAIDFADMVPILARTMANNDAYRRGVTGRFDHVLVDEYQDVNPGQVLLLDHFVGNGVALWAVGDDDQTLYGFRASDIRYILDFEKRHPDAVVHVLDRNYRSARQIVSSAKTLIRKNRARRDKDFQADTAEQGEIVVRGYPTPDLEARQIAQAVGVLLEQGFRHRDIAILYRSSSVGLPIQIALKDAGIPFEVRGGGDVWKGQAAKLTVGALHYVRDGASVRAMTLMGSNKRSEIVRQRLDEVRTVLAADFRASCRHVQRIVGEAMPSSAADRDKQEWTSLVDAVIALADDCAAVEDLEAKVEAQSASLRQAPEHAVVLSTVHSAKGLEWEAVFLAGMEDGTIPNVNAADVEEERRIAYVGITRAKRLLGLTYVAERFNTKAKPSPFLFELKEDLSRRHVWTGPKQPDADRRLPLMTAAERAGRLQTAPLPPASPASKPAQLAGKVVGGASTIWTKDDLANIRRWFAAFVPPEQMARKLGRPEDAVLSIIVRLELLRLQPGQSASEAMDAWYQTRGNPHLLRVIR